MAKPVFSENLTKVFPNSKYILSLCPVMLEPGIILNADAFLLQHEPLLQHVQMSVLINRTIKEMWSQQLFTLHPSLYHYVWRIMFHFLKIMWILLGPECNFLWSTALVYATFIIKVAFSHFAIVLMPESSLHIYLIYSLNPCLLAAD
jgi:hypothetical protein